MVKKRLLIFFFLLPLWAYASVPVDVSLDVLAKSADHLLIGHVVGVDMIDGQGRQITDANAMTGPSTRNLIRLVVEIDEVVVSGARAVPKIIKVPLDPAMHYRLGKIKDAYSNPSQKFLLLLHGENFQPAFPGVFRRNLSDKSKVIELMKANKSALPSD